MVQIVEATEPAHPEACALIAHRLSMQVLRDAALRPAGAEPSWYPRRFAPARRADPKGGPSTPSQKAHHLAQTGRLSEAEFDLFWSGYDCELAENA